MKKHLFEILLLLFSVAIPFALDMNLAVYGMLATFLLFLALRRLNYWLFALVFGFVLITCVLFLPQIIWFGHPPATMIGAFFETDFQESKEFMQQLPFYAYGVSVFTLVFGGYILYLGKKKTYPRSRNQKFITLGMAVVGVLLTLYRPWAKIKEEGSFQWQNTRTAPIAFYASIYHNVQYYKQLRADLNQSIKSTPSWQVVSANPKYANYVLVIGESVRKDYMSAYGFPVENSSFLKSAKGTLIDGYTATAPNTTTALLRMFLKQKDGEFAYADNLISLAKAAGFGTYWISNQGSVGEWDTPIAKIASLCDHKVFTKKGDYSSMNIYDTALLPVLQRFLAKKSTQPRLFVVHIMGSHTYFPERLEHAIHYDYYNRNFSAYLQTIEQTDAFLQSVYKLLEAQHLHFSMLYFADHGLMTKDRSSSFFATLTHGDTHPNKAVYRIPFALLNSDDSEHKVIKVNKLAFHFLKGYAHWLGIEEPSLSGYDFLSTIPDTLKVFNQYENVPFESLEEDEVIRN